MSTGRAVTFLSGRNRDFSIGHRQTPRSRPPGPIVRFDAMSGLGSSDPATTRRNTMEAFEPPKYLASLIAAVNDGAKSAQLGALAFTAIGLFLLATAFSATDEDLLLNRAITISQLGGAAVPVVFAFGLAPAVFVAAHFYTLIRYDMLAGNMRRFNTDLAAMVPDEIDRDRCRQLLANIEFVNALAMPKGSRASSWMFRWTVSALLAVFPVAVLLIVQLQSLRLQSEWVSWTHHICIFADLVLLIWFFGRLRGDDSWHFWRAPIRRKVALCWMPAVVLTVDLLWLEVPGPAAKTVGRYPWGSVSFMERVGWWTSQPVDQLLCTPGAWGCRFLAVHRLIVPKVWDATTFVAVRADGNVDARHRASFEAASLRERTLRFADLGKSELFAVDLMGADLRGANLAEAQLQGADLTGAQLQGADLAGAQLQGADLTGAQLQSNLAGAQLQGTRLGGLSSAQLQGALLVGAQLQGARLSRGQLQGAGLIGAQLQGADLRGAQLQGADLRGAGLWNITADETTRFGLADLRDADFAPVSEKDRDDLLAKLPDGTPESVKQWLRGSLTAEDEVTAQTLPSPVNTKDGKILVTDRNATAWRGLDRATQLTTEPADIDPALAALLANAVAPTDPHAAENVAAQRVIYPAETDKQRRLIKLLGCRLQAQAAANKVTLAAGTIERLRQATGPCQQPSP